MALPENEIRRLEEYHQARRQAEFPGPMTTSGAIIGGVLGGLIVGPLGVVVGFLSGGVAGRLHDRRTAGEAMKKFIQRQTGTTS